MHKGIEVTDPRGRTIRCPGEYWEGHVLGHHPDLAGYEQQVRQALEFPIDDCIFADKTFQNREVYYGRLRNRLEIKVVVEFDASGEGTMKSASPSSKRVKGERLVWSSRKRLTRNNK